MIEDNFATLETLIGILVIAEGRGANDVSLQGIVGDVKAGGWTQKQDGLDYTRLLGNHLGINSTVPHNHEEGINSTSDTGTTMNNPNVNGRDISMEE
jgi:hypothetical protein